MKPIDSTGNPTKVSSNYHSLLMKEFVSELKKHQSDLNQFVKENVKLESVLGMHHYTLYQQHTLFYELFAKLKDLPWVKKILYSMQDKILETAKQLHEFPTQRNYFLTENFRETCNPPLSQDLPSPHLVNLSPLFKVNINKEMRRVLWSKVLVNQQNKFEFFKFDHKVVAYNLNQQLIMGLIRISQENGLKLKQNQKDCCLRLLEYIIKKWDRIPNKNEQALALTVIDVYAHFTPSRMNQIGAVFVGLSELAEFYFEENIDERMKNLQLAFELVDPSTYALIQKSYLPYSQSRSQLNEVFEHFRLTLSAAFLPLAGTQYVIDQMLIKRRNKLDIYIIFSLLTMIMSDQLLKFQDHKAQLTDIINTEISKKTVSLIDIMDAFKVVYENVDVWHVNGEGRLMQKLKQFDASYAVAIAQAKKNQPVSLKLIQPPDDMTGFVVENKGSVLRLGSRAS